MAVGVTDEFRTAGRSTPDDIHTELQEARTMTIDHVLAVVAVSDLDTASRWYAQLFARKPDNNPMPSLVEWQVADHAWVQVFVDADRAGKGLLNFAVSDLAAEVAALPARGLAPPVRSSM
jgi:glyoxylase I family protein